jgi:MinD-like ATPase involved in chromosome partitioning or flagellar assembly
LSEPDWQATALAELGMPLSGLVTPDSGRSSAPTDGHPASPTESPREPPAQPPPDRENAPPKADDRPVAAPVAMPSDESRTQPPPAIPAPDRGDAARTDEGRPVTAPSATRWDEPEPSPAPDQGGAAPEAAATQDRGRPVQAPATLWDESRPRPQATPLAVPGGEQNPAQPPAEQRPAWSPPTWEQPPEPQESPRDEPPMSGWPDQAHEQQEDAGPNQASAWELASQTHWGLVAKTPWGTEPPPEDQAQQPPQAWDRSDAEAWRRDPGPPGSAPPQPAAPPQPGRPVPQDLVRRSVHGDPLMRRMSRGVRRAMGTAAADEIRRTADVAQILSRPVSSCRHIAVTSIRGGAGKTTIAGLTGTALAQYRKDRVLAVDADSGLGSLPLRLGLRIERSLHDLAEARPRSFEETASFLGRTADGLWVLSGTSDGQITGELDLAKFKTVASAMSRYFAALVIDCGAGLLPELQRGILADAHAQVMVTPGTVDGALSARGALEWQARNGYQHLLTRTVIAFVTHTPHIDADLTRAGQLLSGGGMPVVHMPYDRHLATGTAVESARIGQETRAAAIRIALEAFGRAIDV